VGTSWLYELPIWANAVLFVIVLLLAVEAGFQIGLRRSRVNGNNDKLASRDVTLGAMLAMLGLLLAFTYAFTLSRSDHRKQALVNEANAIGTAFLRADLADEPARTELRRLLLDYARTRAVTPITGNREQARRAVERSLKVQANLWPATKSALQGDLPGPIQSSIVQSINEVLDAHTTRMAVAFDFLPAIVLFLLVVISAISLALAAQNAGQSRGMIRWRINAFAVILASLIVIIVDFDRPFEGLIRGSNQSLVALVQDMEATLAD
jgi:hypothetical protein